MPKLSWDDSIWQLKTADPTFACCPPVLGNGLIGVRLGAFILGTDPAAPRWSGTTRVPLLFTLPRFDPASPLPFYARFMRDGALLDLPSWHMLDLKVGGVRFQPGQGLFRGESALDLRTGEATLAGIWETRAWTEPGPSSKVRITIRLLMPRTINHGGFFELSVEGENVQIEASLGWRGSHLPNLPITWKSEGNQLMGDGQTATHARAVRLGSRLELTAGKLRDLSCAGSDPQWHVIGSGGHLALAMDVTVHGGMENGDPDAARAMDLKRLAQGRADGSLRRDNEACWKKLWIQSFDVTTLPVEYRQIVLAQEYYLLGCSDSSSWPTGPQGVAGNSWKGQQMWDADLWTFRALLPLWPDFAESILGARMRQLPEARKAAAKEGREGAVLTSADEDGIDQSNPHSLYRQEVHLSAWPALGVWDFWLTTRDLARLKTYWPLLRDTAQFFVSRCTVDPDGSWHLRGVVPPDEYVCEHGKGACDDSLTTNLLVRAIFCAAHESAALLGEPSDVRWETAAQKLHILGPDEKGIIPEFEGYAGETIKQADVALAFYPLEMDLSEELVRKNLAYYRERCDPYGPLMSRQIDACVLMRLGDREEGLRLLFTQYAPNLRGPFLMPTETPHNSNAGFMTGCGGLLQALIFGFTSYRRPGEDLTLIPRLGNSSHPIPPATRK